MSDMKIGTMTVKAGLAEMLKGGVIMDVTDAEQAKIAEEAGACAVMALERVPSDIRADGGVARMSDPDMIREIQKSRDHPGDGQGPHRPFRRGADTAGARSRLYRRDREVLTPADEANHINKWKFTVPFVCGAINLGEALRRISEGAAMIRTKGEAGTGNVVEAVRHMRTITGEIKQLTSMDEDELFKAAKELRSPYRAGQVGGGERQAAGGQLLGRRSGDSRRRRPDDAARRRGRVRRLRHLQERGSGRPRQGHRRGDHALQRPRGAGAGLHRPEESHDRHGDQGDRRGEPAAEPRLVD